MPSAPETSTLPRATRRRYPKARRLPRPLLSDSLAHSPAHSLAHSLARVPGPCPWPVSLARVSGPCLWPLSLGPVPGPGAPERAVSRRKPPPPLAAGPHAPPSSNPASRRPVGGDCDCGAPIASLVGEAAAAFFFAQAHLCAMELGMAHPGACLPTYFLVAFCVSLGRPKGQGQTIIMFAANIAYSTSALAGCRAPPASWRCSPCLPTDRRAGQRPRWRVSSC